MAWSILCSFHQNILNTHGILIWGGFYSLGISWYKFCISAGFLIHPFCSIKYKLLAFCNAADTEYKYLVNVSDQILRKVRCSDNFLRLFPRNSYFLDCLKFLSCSFLFIRKRRWGSPFCDFKIASRLISNKK